MTNEQMCANLVERYLRTRGRQYFRGHRDGEHFFVTGAPRRLHVHFEISPAHDDVLIIRVTPGCYFPATERPWLTHFADTWNRQDRHVTAIVHGSCDPQRIGVVARKSQWIRSNVSFAEFASLVDLTIADATELFEELDPAAGLPSAERSLLRHAG
ncbi:YbjN domain-containing protein [Mycobacterium intracellulare]|uniref:YbjN domain-containing protein n=1 Tax=Mycobacterium intracellulare TaxID=1767 RepID=A0AAE4RAZ3_MYCIT|nr:YbjN domain-containing protein [Mycobacterium intracellulare]MCA2320915.1 YbjN domain-containing protein [Mycobacterium intracellulare]MCA2341350.1 YbjN domain-containing protein [Mycobacterium intracellulare]MDV6977114.1 YbjN domain-containing protein [Mycobacterium intracellulare]MDV6982411.1 YbjN domain-containing protein [Mycobacterium intracellulare]MDV7012365.1 YbjN domain-containing protein [Mycobacterium intracellulare]